MNVADLGILYGAAGAVSALVLHHQRRTTGRKALVRSLLAVPLWPLWLPVALAKGNERGSRDSAPLGGTESALLEGHEAVRGTEFEALLPRPAVDRILGELRRAGERREELRTLLERPSFGLESARAHVERLGRAGASARALASARLHLANVERLDALRRRDELALEELRELVAALRTQLVLARYAGSTPEDAGDIVSEVWARVEVLAGSEAPALEDPWSASVDGVARFPDT